MHYVILLPIISAFALGICTFFMKFKNEKSISKFAIISAFFISMVTFCTLYFGFEQSIVVLRITEQINFGFKVDGISVIFALMVSILWPIATIYASQYMTHEGNLKKFFTFYTLTYGTVLALSFSKNMLTMYLFYEMLTFITLPLVTHNNKPRDLYAGTKYIFYSVGGASISFMGMMIFMFNVGNWEFVLGGISSEPLTTDLLVAYILMFVGFSVKAGIFPFHRWLIDAGVAPTPVTALLHAVAVVKSGAFAVMRVTYYLFDFESLQGTFAQQFVMILSIITIVFGSAMAMKSKHLKRRLAYSTVSQLSYILLGISTMSYIGLIAALFHMVNHAFMKIVLFFGVGNVKFARDKEYVTDIEGCGTVLKYTFFTFTLCSLSLIGIPPFGGFFSKFALAQSAVGVGGSLGFFAIAALIVSALFTAMYLLQIIVLAYIPHNTFDCSKLENRTVVPKQMIYTLVVLTVIMLVLSLGANQVYNLIQIMIMGEL